MFRYKIMTLGCKLNQYDSARVAGKLGGERTLAAGGEPTDLAILNTCTVTHKADREARRLLRRFRRENPSATIVVMGCSARLRPDVYKNMPEVDVVLTTHQTVDRFLEDWNAGEMGAGCRDAAHPALPYFAERTRAFLKIQEGCRLRCSYCIIPTVRGASRSIPVEDCLRSLEAFLEAGYKEIVLTGVNTGDYGLDLPARPRLESLLEKMVRIPGRFRIRLNSLEPKTITPGLVEMLAAEPKLSRHLQVPLQSGSDRVLETMRRNYRTARYREIVENLADKVPGIGIGADILVGFPAETREDFEETLAFVENTPISYVHAFSYSPRPGTPAADMDQNDPREISSRTNELRALGEIKTAKFARSQAGKPLEALTLGHGAGRGQALTDNFLTVPLEGEKLPPNRFVSLILHEKPDGSFAGASAASDDCAP
jgi:threonylcarbamoyladenosine tRNA methylthiotransferase MtaB